MNQKLGIKNIATEVAKPQRKVAWPRGAVLFFGTFLIFSFIFLILPVSQAQAQCFDSCPGGYEQIGSGCPIDPSCDSDNETCTTGVLCAPVETPTPAPTPAPSTSGGSGTTVTLDNPLGETDFRLVAGNIVKALTGLAGMIALLMFIYGGFTWLTSGGNTERIKKGRDILLWSTAGMVVMFSSYIVVRFIILAITRGVVAP